jgi:hypothetical protein
MCLSAERSSAENRHGPAVGRKCVNPGEERRTGKRFGDDTLDAALIDGNDRIAGGVFHTCNLGKRPLDDDGAELPITPGGSGRHTASQRSRRIGNEDHQTTFQSDYRHVV